MKKKIIFGSGGGSAQKSITSNYSAFKRVKKQQAPEFGVESQSQEILGRLDSKCLNLSSAQAHHADENGPNERFSSPPLNPKKKSQRKKAKDSPEILKKLRPFACIGIKGKQTPKQETFSDQKLHAGLKELSLRVMETVIKLRRTTYKAVATELINSLKVENMSFGSSHMGITDSEIDEFSDESPLKNKLSSKKKGGSVDNGEKNIRRRVYDALNVQFAAGVLNKNDKYIEPNYKCREF